MPKHPGPQPSPGRIGDHAVVLGASMAGLLAARVLADAYAQVTVIDRDQLPQAGSHRRGVPQGRHLHALLAERFRLAPDQIREAMLTAHNRAGWRLAADRHDPGPDPAPPAPTLAELFAASRGQTGHDLTALARKIEPIYGWDDIILPSDPLAQLREICQRVAQRQRVMGAWGFEGRLSHGKGVSALFSGPPGTGKTMAAEVIASCVSGHPPKRVKCGHHEANPWSAVDLRRCHASRD